MANEIPSIRVGMTRAQAQTAGLEREFQAADVDRNGELSRLEVYVDCVRDNKKAAEFAKAAGAGVIALGATTPISAFATPAIGAMFGVSLTSVGITVGAAHEDSLRQGWHFLNDLW